MTITTTKVYADREFKHHTVDGHPIHIFGRAAKWTTGRRANKSTDWTARHAEIADPSLPTCDGKPQTLVIASASTLPELRKKVAAWIAENDA